jgi:hypothetical protein
LHVNFAITEFSEVRSLLPIRFVKQEKCQKKTPTSSKIVANLSPIGKDVGLHAHLRALARKANPS